MDNEYLLTDLERAALQSLNSNILAAKLAVYNLSEQLDAARANVKTADAAWMGALQLLANSHGIVNATIDPFPFTKIRKES